MLHHGEADYGPFADRFQPVPGKSYVEPMTIRVIGATDEPADIPLAVESEVVG